MSSEPLTTTPEPTAASESGLLIAMAILVLTGVAAMLLMTS